MLFAARVDPETKEEEEEEEEGSTRNDRQTDGAVRERREVRRSKGYVAPFLRSFFRSLSDEFMGT